MTADVELLPLPEPNIGLPGQVKFAYSPDLVDKAIRANVEAATAAKDAEIEALRAEVERLNRIFERIIEGDGDSTLTIRADADAFAAAREYLRPNT